MVQKGNCRAQWKNDKDTDKDGIRLSSVKRNIARDIGQILKPCRTKKIFNSMLNHLLDVLLRVHLAPKREKHYREMKAEKKHAAESQ